MVQIQCIFEWFIDEQFVKEIVKLIQCFDGLVVDNFGVDLFGDFYIMIEQLVFEFVGIFYLDYYGCELVFKNLWWCKEIGWFNFVYIDLYGFLIFRVVDIEIGLQGLIYGKDEIVNLCYWQICEDFFVFC